MSEALRKAAEQAHDVLEQLRDLSPKQTVALFALRAALAEPDQSEPVVYQYRWTNPGHRQNLHPSETEWQPVKLLHCKTIPEEAAQLERYTYDGKPTYEVRKLYAAPPRREPLSDEELTRIGKCYLTSQWIRFARAIEAAHGITGVNNAK